MTEDPREKILAFGTAISEGAADIPGLDHWRSLPIAQAPSWADEADHRAAVAEPVSYTHLTLPTNREV